MCRYFTILVLSLGVYRLRSQTRVVSMCDTRDGALERFNKVVSDSSTEFTF